MTSARLRADRIASPFCLLPRLSDPLAQLSITPDLTPTYRTPPPTPPNHTRLDHTQTCLSRALSPRCPNSHSLSLHQLAIKHRHTSVQVANPALASASHTHHTRNAAAAAAATTPLRTAHNQPAHAVSFSQACSTATQANTNTSSSSTFSQP